MDAHVVREVSRRCGDCYAEKENIGCYEQVCDCGTENRLKRFRLKAVGKSKAAAFSSSVAVVTAEDGR